MDFIHIVFQNLFSPAVLFFALGVFAGFCRSDLAISEGVSRFLSIYLMMAIGFKGGVAIANTHGLTLQVIGTLVTGLCVGLLQPFLSYGLLRLTTKLDKPTASAVAAHYGSISIVTFVTASAFLKADNIIYAGYIVAILALMEAPAIFSGLFIAHHVSPQTKHVEKDKRLLREIFTNGAILLLFGAFLIGCITGQSGMDKVEGFLNTPFQGILCLFLLDMGLLVSKNLHHLKGFTWPLIFFGLYMPLIGAAIGLGCSYVIGLDIGTGTLFTVLCASASYIAVPAAMRLALPEAKPAVYLPLSLAITFPFNITLGIPIYYALASHLLIHPIHL